MSSPESLTTLELAHRIADAVLVAAAAAHALNRPASWDDAPTQAVLAVLRDTGHTFCRLVHEGTDGTPPPMPGDREA